MTTATIRLHPSDNVIIALQDLGAGAVAEGVTLLEAVPRGHKVAVVPIAAGGLVIRYGQIIGAATKAVSAGAHVHVHNLGMGAHDTDYAYGTDLRVLPTPNAPRSFMGFHRADGGVGTRNYLGVLTSVNCSGSVARFIAEAAEKQGLLEDFPNVDGVVPIVHGTGCGMSGNDEGYDTLFRTLQGYARNP
ncbi:MAG: UxaA family hydrolase, partial [Paracoccaceae bacterium]